MEVVMSHISHGSSTLNPNAPMFVPMAYRSVEDFSDQWWALVQSCPWFRDYWLQERFHDPQSELADPDQTRFPNANGFCYDTHAEAEADLPDDDDLDDYYSLFFNQQEDQEEEMMMMMMMMREYYNNSTNSCRDLVSMEKWQKGARPLVQAPPRYAQKPPKIVNVKVSPRIINQPK